MTAFPVTAFDMLKYKFAWLADWIGVVVTLQRENKPNWPLPPSSVFSILRISNNDELPTGDFVCLFLCQDRGWLGANKP